MRIEVLMRAGSTRGLWLPAALIFTLYGCSADDPLARPGTGGRTGGIGGNGNGGAANTGGSASTGGTGGSGAGTGTGSGGNGGTFDSGTGTDTPLLPCRAKAVTDA